MSWADFQSLPVFSCISSRSHLSTDGRAGLHRLRKSSWSFQRPARAQYSSRGKRPRKARPIAPTLKGSHIPRMWHAKHARCHPSSTPSGSNLVGGMFSGGVAPGYYIYPLRGSRTNSPGEFFRSLCSPALPRAMKKSLNNTASHLLLTSYSWLLTSPAFTALGR